MSDYRDELLALRNAEANRLHADLAIVCPGYAQICRRLTAERSLATAEQLLADLPAVRAQLARRRITRLRELDTEIRQLADQLARLVTASRTRLVDLVGVGPMLAARILGEVGDVARFPDADHFAAANGTAPIPVASGRTDRHRLNRVAIVASTARCTMWPSPRQPGSLERSPTWPASGRRQDQTGSPAVPQTTAVHRHLQGPARRTQATRPHQHHHPAGHLTIEAQRQGRTLPPHPGQRVGLCAALYQRQRAPSRLAHLAAWL